MHDAKRNLVVNALNHLPVRRGPISKLKINSSAIWYYLSPHGKISVTELPGDQWELYAMSGETPHEEIKSIFYPIHFEGNFQPMFNKLISVVKDKPWEK
jgi:hypothetical protein